MAFIRVLVVALAAITFILNISFKQRLIILAGLLLVFMIVTIAIVSIESRPPQESTSIATVPTVRPAPTRPPQGPSFETACRTFQLITEDLSQGELDNYSARGPRFEQLRSDAQFVGSPEKFRQLIENYIATVDRKLGTDVEPGLITSPNVDVAELDREIRRARDELFSECRARQN